MDSTLQAVLSALLSFLIVTFIFAVVVLVCKGSSKRHRSAQPRSRARTRQVRPRTVPNDNPDLSSITIGESASFDPSLNRVSMPELIQATENFSPDLIIGDGSFGLVYKAKLSTGVTVALKKLSADAFQGLREFRAEMETLGKIRHPNIVKILGFCAVGSERILIYEFIERGSLDQWLYDTSSPTTGNGDVQDSVIRLPLYWETRIKIIKGVAKGLAYMHNLVTPIIHRDIKASNVLLDQNFEAHIADFGLARSIEGSHTHVSTQVAGTMGYMPPEYIGGATTASVMGDVYSFGILLLEIITRRRPNFPFVGEDGREVRLLEWVKTMAKENRYMEMVDTPEDVKENIVMEVFRIATMCTFEIPKLRPSMNQVVELLDAISS
ncbi:hypothetical protein M9H77_31744 [Catharanthus roseus]|uniref:Uncharacterized protein n=1 Tax=Catharanthus roseus TaxID=4058 RepID=A0ACC0A3N0_CATRO|nr:hypothetical protein M9H77_31744 [Catharanthus roseus]